MWILETVVTAAPLLGLLGTITGMMQAFKVIGGSGLVAPTQVTSGVAQALISTALGLLIALFALFGFNFFARTAVAGARSSGRLGSKLIDHIRLDEETGREGDDRQRDSASAARGQGQAMKLRKGRGYRRGRIEIIPMIDVMFFLLVTFMLASLSMQSLNSITVNLPQGDAPNLQHKEPVALTITKDSKIFLDKTPTTLATLAFTLKSMLQGAGSREWWSTRTAPRRKVSWWRRCSRRAGPEWSIF